MGKWGFTYDSLNRLITGTPSTGDFSGGNNYCWSYDAWGNRTAQVIQTAACPTPPSAPAGAITYTTDNQVPPSVTGASAVSYDASGDAISTVTSIGQTYYSYDAEGRVCAVQSTPMPGMSSAYGYLYDADGTRVAKGTITPVASPGTQTLSCDPTTNGFQFTENYVLGPSGEELTMFGVPAGGSPGNTTAWQRTNLYAGGKLLATADTIGLHFHLEDPLGTRRMQLSGEITSMGQPETDIQSLPFGDQLNSYPDQYAPSTADDSTPLHFTGKERDTESGLDYFGARYNSSSMGRFMSPDPLGGNLADPQSLNRYSYVLNNPLRFTDPTGMYTCKDSKDCSSKADQKFEKSLAGLRGSKNADIARAAGAYGAANSNNGVNVGFTDLTMKGENGTTVSTIEADPNGPDGSVRAHSEVTINSKITGDDLASTVGHEGSHAADAQDVVRSGLTPDGEAIHAGMNITPYQSEQRAYGVSSAILSQENQSRKYDCGMTACTLGVGSGMAGQLPGVIDQIVAHNPVYNQGGQPMGPNNQGPSVVNSVTPKATVPH